MNRDRSRRLSITAATVLFAVCLPIFLIAWNVRVLANSPTLYEYDFTNYNIERRTGIERPELTRAARQLIDYFNDDEEWLDLRVVLSGREVSLYNDREVRHMRDVKDLIRGVFQAGWATAVILAALAAGGAALLGRDVLRTVRRAVAWSAAGSVIFIAVIGIWTAISFRSLFTVFHQISFANDLWQLSPSSSYLLTMFPQGFWFDATMALAGATVLEFALLYALARWADRRFGEPRTPGRGAASAEVAPAS